MARTAPVPNIPAIPGMNPGVFILGGGGNGGGSGGRGGNGAGGAQGAGGNNGITSRPLRRVEVNAFGKADRFVWAGRVHE